MKRMRYSPTKIADTYLIGEQSLKRIADTTGTPLYLYDKRKIKEQWGKLKSFLPDFVDVYYSVKSNPNREIVDYINNLGGNFETASLGEMNIVTQYDDKQKIIVGPGKTTQEIDFALTHGFYIVAESINEIKRINQICFERQIITKIAIRINPGYSNGLVSMGGNTQFGMDIKTVHELSMIIRDLKNIKINGLHFYLATGILSTSQIVENLKQVIKTIDTITKCLKFELEVIDVGGGLGIPYYEEDKNLDLSLITEEYGALISNIRRKYKTIKNIIFEAGRFLVGESGVFLTKIIDIKETYGKKFIILDGGTSAFGLSAHDYGFKILPFKVLNHLYKNQKDVYTICGPLCTPTDRLAVDVYCEKPEVGDIMAFYQAGAYGYSAGAGLFLSRGFPKEKTIN